MEHASAITAETKASSLIKLKNQNIEIAAFEKF